MQELAVWLLPSGMYVISSTRQDANCCELLGVHIENRPVLILCESVFLAIYPS
jgi:hypothetical protein